MWFFCRAGLDEARTEVFFHTDRPRAAETARGRKSRSLQKWPLENPLDMWPTRACSRGGSLTAAEVGSWPPQSPGSSLWMIKSTPSVQSDPQRQSDGLVLGQANPQSLTQEHFQRFDNPKNQDPLEKNNNNHVT